MLVLYFMLSSYFFINVINAKLTKEELEQCQSIELQNLVISTSSSESLENYDVPIFENCEVNKYWVVRNSPTYNTHHCIIPERVFEGEDIIRRPIRFSYLRNNQNAFRNSQINILNINIEGNKNIADTTVTKSSFSLKPGEARDIYIDYECRDMDVKKTLPTPWVTLLITITFDNDIKRSFEFTKICTASYKEQIDFSHLVIVIFVFLVIFLSVKDFLKSNIEITIVEKFTEIKNVENLFIISVCVFLIIVFFNYIGNFVILTDVSSALVGVFSLSLLFDVIFKYFNILQNLELSSYEIPFIGSITFFYLACLGSGIFVYFIWYISKFWILNDIISFSIALITIRIIKFTSVKFLYLMFIGIFFYLLRWTLLYSQYVGENLKLSNNSPINVPLKLICPEFRHTPFGACTGISIADIILPGIYLMYLKKFDYEHNNQSSTYFQSGFVGLFAGLGSNLIVYYIYSLPTPSFLYTGPFIVFISIIIALQKGEIGLFFTGFVSTSYENKTDDGIVGALRNAYLNNYSPVNLPPKNNYELKEF